MLTDRPLLSEYEYGGCRIACLVTGEEWQQNTYIVTDTSSLNTIVIDPGGSVERIIQRITDINVVLTHILLTHPHHDHVGAAAKLSEQYNMACELHKQDVRLLVHAPMYAWTFAKRKIPAVSHYRAFEELVIKEKPAFRALHTPGHTKGSVCYIFDGFLFTGDTLLCKHVGRTDLPGGNSTDLSTSVDMMLGVLPDDAVIFPGHGRPWSVGEAREWWRQFRGKPPAHMSFTDPID